MSSDTSSLGMVKHCKVISKFDIETIIINHYNMYFRMHSTKEQKFSSNGNFVPMPITIISQPVEIEICTQYKQTTVLARIETRFTKLITIL